jgi:hypothetical protein
MKREGGVASRCEAPPEELQSFTVASAFLLLQPVEASN